MPLILAVFLAFGVGEFWGWRASMFVAGLTCLVTGIAYYRFTQDCPEGNYKDLRSAGRMPFTGQVRGAFAEASKDYRVWALFLAYAGCFGMELTFHNIAGLYFLDHFDLGLKAAGMAAAIFGLTAIFARTLGGYLSDRFALRRGLRGRKTLLVVSLFFEGIFLLLFSRSPSLPLALAALVPFALFVQMSCGATFALVPFINKRALGSVAGIVGAGGNVGAVLAGFLFKGSLPWPTALMILGGLVVACSFVVIFVSFSEVAEKAAVAETEAIFAATAKLNRAA
jgi:NNP family nitrate/nitrite transporter-like MFS transporter